MTCILAYVMLLIVEMLNATPYFVAFVFAVAATVALVGYGLRAVDDLRLAQYVKR